MSTHPVIELKGITKSFGGVHALKNVDLTIEKGEIHALAGENGSGKSTLIKVLCGVHQPDEGEIIIDGVPCKHMTPITAIKMGIQVIYQDFSIFPNLTVMENIAINTEIMDRRKLINQKRMRQIAQKAVDRIGFQVDLDETLDHLSVADKQLVAISRALLNNVKLIIMDEATTALTQKEVEKLFSIVKMLQAEGIAILFVSHKTDEVFEISKRYTILRSGERIITGDVATLKRDDFAYYMTGRKFTAGKLDREINSEIFFEVRNLTKGNAFADISFQLHRGEILCIAGLLGSGRTELSLSLFGAEPADSGEIYMDGQPVRIRSIQDAMKYKIGYVPEDRLTEGLFLDNSIYDNEVISNMPEHTGRFGIIDKDTMRKEGSHWIQAMNVNTQDMDRLVSTLPGGNQQKVILGRWLATHLKLLILNGPTVGVDIGAKYDIHQLLRELSQEGMSVIIISDDIAEIFACSDRIVVMKHGRLCGEFITREIDEKTLSDAMFGNDGEA